ncbi:hypothetical protein JIG36_05490 [Actinoplanes sp. LDG1-06]|uniref:Uncharacterized protein n=1 Tax=Paractinoplanes ovalisporus TaxID=2810368 RepID=A0ABS2A5A1_9ACTN|nr:hypothetical protein [Actinoplanes ovalisporus]MBM2615011.1 hypothetical protein [Actinoplanes ovalisporus]
MDAEPVRAPGHRFQVLGQHLDELVVDVAGHQEPADADLLPDLQRQVVRLDRARDLGLVLHDELAVDRQHILGQVLQRRRAVLGRQQRRLPGQEPPGPVHAELGDEDVLPGRQLQQPGERHRPLLPAFRGEERVQSRQSQVPYGMGTAPRGIGERGVVEGRVQPLPGRRADHDQLGHRGLDQPPRPLVGVAQLVDRAGRRGHVLVGVDQHREQLDEGGRGEPVGVAVREPRHDLAVRVVDGHRRQVAAAVARHRHPQRRVTGHHQRLAQPPRDQLEVDIDPDRAAHVPAVHQRQVLGEPRHVVEPERQVHQGQAERGLPAGERHRRGRHRKRPDHRAQRVERPVARPVGDRGRPPQMDGHASSSWPPHPGPEVDLSP